ncbi:MAG: hypothetical protein DMD78_20930 [Candidatus Rokuibacteriota bacterium]|nr:MAG: hypothetical protein DMD78_20930 [Candidatus Rokubacteria bacterium]
MKDHISSVLPRTLPKPQGFSYGFEVKHGRLVFIAGQVARDGNNVVVGKGDVVAQFRQVCANIQAVMSAAGGEMPTPPRPSERPGQAAALLDHRRDDPLHRPSWGAPKWPPCPPALGAPRPRRGAPRSPAR